MNLNTRVSDLQRDYLNKRNNHSSSDDEHNKKKKPSSSDSDDEKKQINFNKVYANEVLAKLKEPEITVQIVKEKIDHPDYTIEIFLGKYTNFLQQVNSRNGLILAEDFNNLEKGYFNGIYTYPKELYTKDLNVGLKKILEDNGIQTHPFKFVCGI
jgi:hypothetical protein